MKIISETAIDGGKRIEFEAFGKNCILCVPNKPREDKRVFWRAEFFTAFDNCDAELFKMGFYRAYIGLSNMFGSPDAVGYMKKFHDLLVNEFGINPKVILVGVSRGGLYSVNYAATYPEDVVALYLDAPVLNLLSWPFGRGKYAGSPQDIELALAEFGMTEGEVLSFRGSPIDKVEAVAKADIPIMFVCGAIDKTVYFDENSEVFIKRFKALGGRCDLILKPDCDHHPHGLENPKPIIDFLLENMK